MSLERIEARHGERPVLTLGQRTRDLSIRLAVNRARREALEALSQPLSTRAHNRVCLAFILVGLSAALFIALA